MEPEKLKSVIESILFVSGEPVEINRIVKITGAAKPEVENAIMVLQNEYVTRGLVLVRKEDVVQLVTNPENASFVDKLVKSEMQEHLSPAALEVLSIVGYRGPITRVDIEAIRGVNCSFTLRALLLRGLVERIDNPKDNRGYLYKISIDFMKFLGISNIEKLPDWENMRKDGKINSVINNAEQVSS